MGKAVVLSSAVSGGVNINKCKFVNNTHYRGHGVAIHYSLMNATSYQSVFTISNCSFTYNKLAKSLVYIENSISNHNIISLNHSKFYLNQGTPVHVVNQKIYLSGKVLFQNNTAENCASM